MNISAKRTQYIILAAFAGCGLLFLVLHFLILPAVSSWKKDSAKTREIEKKLAEIRQTVQSKPVIQSQIETTKAAVKTMAGNIPLPVLGNYLLGMEEHLRACAGDTGVTVVSIADNDALEITRENSRFKIYRVRVQARAGLHDYVRLAANIYRSNPLISISGINIAARNDSPSVHEISFVVSWLVWSEPAKRQAFLIEGNK